MHLFSLVSLLLFAAAVGGYAYLFRTRQLQRLQRLREADARPGRGRPDVPARLTSYPARAGKRSRGAATTRNAPPVSAGALAVRLAERAVNVVVQLVWVLLFTVLIGIGIILPGAGALKLFHNAGLLTQVPITPASLLGAVRYAGWTGVGLVMLGMLGLRRYGPLLAVFLAGLFACSVVAAILFSSLVTMPVHLVVSPLFGIDVWNDWRPFVHLAFVVLGVPWAFSICWEARRDLLDDSRDTGYGSSYCFSGNPGTAVAAGGSMFSGLFGDSGGSGGSWSGDSGGDSD